MDEDGRRNCFLGRDEGRFTAVAAKGALKADGLLETMQPGVGIGVAAAVF